MADTQVPLRLTSLAHGGGCGCKLSPDVLSNLLRDLPLPADRDLLVDASTSDDAAVYRINDTTALIATTDFFTPIVDDPHVFGQIAATNALSDIYAMGGRPVFSLAITGMPIDRLAPDTIRAILAGGALAAFRPAHRSPAAIRSTWLNRSMAFACSVWPIPITSSAMLPHARAMC